MDRVIPASEQKAHKRKRIVRAIIIGFVLACVGYGILLTLRPSASANDYRFATVDRGPVKATIRATGTVQPAFEEQLNAPVATEIQQVHLRTGAEVATGDLIMTLDREYVALQLDGRRDQLTLRQNNVALEKLAFARDLRDLAIDTEVAQLELSSAEAQLADAKRLEAVGGATAEDVERASLAVQMAGLAKDKLSNQLQYRRSADEGQQRRLGLEVAMEEKEVAQLARRLRETEVKAPRPGVITWVNESIGQLVTEGAPLVRLANLGAFRIEASCSDRYAAQLSVGQTVDIRLSNSTTTGLISDILPEINNNTVRFLVALDQPDFEGLRPSMRVDVSVITAESEAVLRVKNGPAINGSENQQLYVVRGEEALLMPVVTGNRGGEYIEIISGLTNGDRIIISDTDNLNDRASIRLKTTSR